MALTNFILTVAGVSAVVLLLRSDVKQSATIFRRNVKHIRNWLEEESTAASKECKAQGAGVKDSRERCSKGETLMF
ncbi:DNA double-strand break repair rad50 ATPase [Melia azedarach]|uniref:DNA double-strand break repair rad50 ATPase n=1 Tax=Melia azedarach TaxID=155640 RepID=A0ACC1Z0J0_MELAZ|nr:DNA double-strand break repair rad50 ATPase [Melia azedarach]